MTISREEIIQASGDARLELTPEEAAELEKQVANVIQQAVFLQNNKLDDIEATYYLFGQKNILREDITASSLPMETALANAPEAESAYIHVPKIVE